MARRAMEGDRDNPASAIRSFVDTAFGSTFQYYLVDTRVYSPLSDISPALSADSGATNMQHMAVIKDFLVSL